MSKLASSLLLLLFLSFHLVAQNVDSNKANTLFSEGKYSAAQSLYQQIIRNNPSDENAHYYNARCSKELFASDAIFLYKQFLLSFPFTAFYSLKFEGGFSRWPITFDRMTQYP